MRHENASLRDGTRIGAGGGGLAAAPRPAVPAGAAPARAELARPEDAGLQPPRAGVPGSAPVLSDSNPVRLSRAEFRLCHLLSTGLGLKSVQAELGITDSTFRTHLRNVYDKTGTRSEAELVALLREAAPAAAAAPDRAGRRGAGTSRSPWS